MKKYFLLFTACFVIFIIHVIFSGHAIYGDGNGYYSYAHSIYFEKSLNFEPIYKHLSNFEGKKYTFSRIFWNTEEGPLGIKKNPYTLGTAFFWIPSIAFISLFINDKFSLLYELGTGITGITLSLLGLYFLEKYLNNFYSKKVSVTASLLFFAASNLFYYSSFEPALSHQPAFFIICLLLYKTYKMPDKFLNYFLVGALSGLLFITRMADTVFLLPIYFNLLKLKPKWDHFIMAPVGMFVFSLPLFTSYYLMFGSPFHNPYLTGENGFFSFNIKNIFDFLLSAKRGLFMWHPIYLISLVGLFKSKNYIVLATLLLFTFVSSFWSANTSAGFGQRFAIAGVPLFVLGFAYLVKNFKNVFAITIILIFWNLLTIFQFYFDSKNLIKNENLTVKDFVVGQIYSPIKAFDILKTKGVNYIYLNNVLD